MIDESKYSELEKKIRKGILKAQKKMLEEKALHNETVIIGDLNGKPIEIKASKALAQSS
uniref:Uncharacterized protein n=3 Tax=unclassified Prevotella TaxID=2638335 RepID=A0AB33JJI4_9BACT